MIHVKRCKQEHDEGKCCRCLVARALARLDKPSFDACWTWTGSLTLGYGKFGTTDATFYVHRVVYEAFVGPIPDGFQIDHLCRNRACANPEHLEAVTQTENLARGESPTALNARRTHCTAGHEFTEENTYHRPDRPHTRGCKRCSYLRNKATKDRRRLREQGDLQWAM